jgi:hypothetical protein
MQREHVISQYKEQTQNKQYHWINSSKRKSVRDFFIESYEFQEDFYDQHESVFLFLVLKDKKLAEKYGVK